MKITVILSIDSLCLQSDDMNKFMVVQLDFDPSSRPENPSFIAAYNDRVVFTDLASQMVQVRKWDTRKIDFWSSADKEEFS